MTSGARAGQCELSTVMRECPYIVTGLRRAGFTNGWL